MKPIQRPLRAAIHVIVAGALALSLFQARADELLRTIQADLVVLGYDPGPADGELTMKSQLAIAKFEEANELPVTGKPSMAVAAAASNQADAARSGAAPAAAGTAAAGQARADCLQQLAAAKAAQQQKKKGIGSLVNTGTRLAGRFGGAKLARDIQEVSRTASDVAGLAEDFGLTADEAATCD